MQTFTGPIRAKDAKGRWQDIDTTLVDSGDKIRPKQAAADVSLSDGTSAEPLVEVERGKHALGIGWTGDLPKPEMKGATATYKDAVAGAATSWSPH